MQATNAESFDIGGYSFHIEKDATESLMLFYHVPDAKLVGGTTYIASMYVKATVDSTMNIKVRGGNKVNGNSPNFTMFTGVQPASEEWVRVSGAFTYPVGNADDGFSFIIDLLNMPASEFYVDNFSVVTTDEYYAENGYLTNASFDDGLENWTYGAVASGLIATNDPTGFTVADCDETVTVGDITVGQNALHMEKTNEQGRRAIYQYIPLSANDHGKQFQVTAYLNLVSGGLSRIGIRTGNRVNGNGNDASYYLVDGAEGSSYAEHTGPKVSTGGWKRHSLVFTYNHIESEPGVCFVVDSVTYAGEGTSVDVWLDEVSVVETETLLRMDGAFEAYTEFDRAAGPATSLQRYTYGTGSDMRAGSSATGLKADMELVSTGDAGYALRMNGKEGANNPFVTYLQGAKWDALEVGDVVKLTAKVKLNKTAGTDAHETIAFRYGARYGTDLFAEGIQTSAISIPASAFNKWIDVEFLFEKRDVENQMVYIVPGILGTGVSLDIDNVKAVPAPEYIIEEANVYANAEEVIVKSSAPEATTACATLVKDASAPAYKKGANTYAVIFDGGLENKMASYALYKDNGTTTNMIGVSIPEDTASSWSVLRLAIPETLDTEATYTVKAMLWGGANFFTPAASTVNEIAE